MNSFFSIKKDNRTKYNIEQIKKPQNTRFFEVLLIIIN